MVICEPTKGTKLRSITTLQGKENFDTTRYQAVWLPENLLAMDNSFISII